MQTKRVRAGRQILAGAVAMVLSGAAALAAPITAGNLVVTRAGDGAAALSGGGVAAAVFLDEYTPAGALVQSIPVNPTLNATIGSQRALTFSATANTEGAITLSQDGQFMAFGGYNQTAGVAGTNGAASNVVERVAGLLNLSTGGIDTSTAFIDVASTNQNIRTVYTTNGSSIWASGSGGGNVTINAQVVTTSGVHYGVLGVNTGGTTLSTQLNSTGVTTQSRVINVFGSTPRMYVSTSAQSAGNGAPARGPDTFNTGGLPTTTGNVLNSLPGFPTGNQGTPASAPSPDDFWFFDDNLVYVADTRNDGNGGIQKWAFDGANWNLQYTMGGTANGLSTIGGGNTGVHGLTGVSVGGQVVLYATSFDSAGANQTKLYSIIDTGASSPYTLLATAPTNTAFRGVEIATLAPVPEPASVVSIVGLAGLAFIRRRAR